MKKRQSDEAKNDAIDAPRTDSWEHFFELADRSDIPESFMTDRGDRPPDEPQLADCNNYSGR